MKPIGCLVAGAALALVAFAAHAQADASARAARGSDQRKQPGDREIGKSRDRRIVKASHGS